jgi:hypothetical protein
VADTLTVVGAILQVVGLAFVFVELAVIRSLEFDVPTPWARLATWVRKLLKRPKTIEAEISVSAKPHLSLHGKVRPGPIAEDATLGEKVAWLESYVTRIDEDIDSVPALVENKAAETLQKARDHSEGVRREVRQLGDRRRAAVRPSIRRQAAGAVCVLVGTILGTMGAVWPDDAVGDHDRSAPITVTATAPAPAPRRLRQRTP